MSSEVLKSFRADGKEERLRERILTLPLMVAAVLTLLWRDVPGVTELERIFKEILPSLKTRWLSRHNRSRDRFSDEIADQNLV